MIKLSKYLYIHALTPVIFVVSCFVGKLSYLAAVYFSMLLHECAHLVAAKLIGLRISRVVLYPFGVNLTLKNTLIASLGDEVILYLSGPLMNILIAGVWQRIFGRDLFYYNNVLLFALNMLPILPLDGGFLLRRGLTAFFGSKTARVVLNVCSGIFLAAVGAVLAVYGRLNSNSLVFMLFLAGNFLFSGEKYKTDLLRELCFYSEKKDKKPVKVLLFDEDFDKREIIRKFRQSSRYVVMLKDNNDEITRILTEKKLIDNILSNK